MTCSSLMRSWSLSLRTGPWRPPLRGLMKTIIGVRGATELSYSPSRMQRLSPTVASCKLTESRIANRKYCGIVRFRLSSSLSTRWPEMPHPLIDSTIEDLTANLFASPIVEDDDDDDGEFIVSHTSDRFLKCYLWYTMYKMIDWFIWFFEMSNYKTCIHIHVNVMIPYIWGD